MTHSYEALRVDISAQIAVITMNWFWPVICVLPVINPVLDFLSRV